MRVFSWEKMFLKQMVERWRQIALGQITGYTEDDDDGGFQRGLGRIVHNYLLASYY